MHVPGVVEVSRRLGLSFPRDRGQCQRGIQSWRGVKRGDAHTHGDAHAGPEDFLARHRAALEAPPVSRALPAWIDLVFGCKQVRVVVHGMEGGRQGVCKEVM